MTRLLLLRHGETEGNVQQVWHGALDAPLTARGQQQVAATVQYIGDVHRHTPIDHLVVSPLPRALRTAEPIAHALNLPMRIEPGLSELNLGEWEGRTFADLRDVENLWERWRQEPTFAPPRGESPYAFQARVMQAFQQLVTQHPTQTVLAVTHGGVIGAALLTWLRLDPKNWRQWDPHNCAISILQHTADQWQPVAINRIDHLPADAIVSIAHATDS